MSRAGKRRNLFLAGMMGSGKSVVGRRAARQLDYVFIDTDAIIERESSMTIAEIFAGKGEAFFRATENRLLREIAAGEEQVVATGGGMLIDNGNLDLAAESGLVIYLYAPVEVLATRVTGSDNRPLLEGAQTSQRMKEIYQRRREYYERIAARVDTSSMNVGEVTQAAVEIYRKWLAK